MSNLCRPAAATAPAPLPCSALRPIARDAWRRPLRAQRLAAAAEPPPAAAATRGHGPEQQQPVPVTFHIGGVETTVDATPGQNIWEVAKDAGVDITLGCSQGFCGACEVEVWKYSSGSSSSSRSSRSSSSSSSCGNTAPPSVGVARSCIAGVPPGYARLEVREVPEDDIWGVDGFDT